MIFVPKKNLYFSDRGWGKKQFQRGIICATAIAYKAKPTFTMTVGDGTTVYGFLDGSFGSTDPSPAFFDGKEILALYSGSVRILFGLKGPSIGDNFWTSGKFGKFGGPETILESELEYNTDANNTWWVSFGSEPRPWSHLDIGLTYDQIIVK